MTIETLKSPNPRDRKGISLIKSKFLSVSSMNTLLAILKVTDARRDVILAGGLYHRFPWRHLPPPPALIQHSACTLKATVRIITGENYQWQSAPVSEYLFSITHMVWTWEMASLQNLWLWLRHRCTSAIRVLYLIIRNERLNLMLWVVPLGFMTTSLLSMLANHNQASKIWLDRLKNIMQSIVSRLGEQNGTAPLRLPRKKNREVNGKYYFINCAVPQAAQLMTIFKWVF